MSIRALSGVLCLLTLCNISDASTLVLRSGETREGRIIDASADQIYFQFGDDILNYPQEQILEITGFSDEEIQAGFDAQTIQELRESTQPFRQAQDFANREFTTAELKEKLIDFKNFILAQFSNDLKTDEKEILNSLEGVLNAPAPPEVPVVTPENIVQATTAYQSEFHEKILKLLRRYLEQWIAQANAGQASFEQEERFVERIIGKTRTALLRAFLPSMESVRGTVDGYLKHLDTLNRVAEHATQANR